MKARTRKYLIRQKSDRLGRLIISRCEQLISEGKGGLRLKKALGIYKEVYSTAKQFITP